MNIGGKRVVFFIDELYFYDEQQDCYVSQYSGGRFLEMMQKELALQATFVIPVRRAACPVSYATCLKEDNIRIEPLPGWKSIVSYYKLLLNPKWFFVFKKKIRGLFGNSHIFWIRLPSPFGLWLGTLAEKKGKFVLYHVAGDIRFGYLSPKYKGCLRLLARVMGTYLYKKSLRLGDNSLFFCTGSKLLDLYDKAGKKTIPFIDSLINRNFLSMPKNELGRPIKFLYVGRILEEKGIYFLIKAIERLAEIYEVNLDIVGFGDDVDKLKKMIKNKNNIKYIGFIKNGPDLFKIYKDNDIFVLPSLYSEGFPRTIIEAWANGMYVISSRVGGIEGLGKDGENLMFFKAGDEDDFMKKVRLIIENGELRNKLAKGVREVQEVITFEYSVSIIKNIINEI